MQAEFRDSCLVSGSLSHMTPFTPTVPVPWFLTAAALASLLPRALWRREVTFGNVWWEVRVRRDLEFGPCT